MAYTDNKRRVLASVLLAVVLVALGFLIGIASHSSPAAVPAASPAQLAAARHNAAAARHNAAAARQNAAAAREQAAVAGADADLLRSRSRRLARQIVTARACLTSHRSHVRRCLHNALR
jgi:hypothetical protein